MIVRPLYAVLERELLKLFRQRGRLLASMVRPLLWLIVIGGGFAAIQSGNAGPGYQHFLVPGVMGMTLLFGGMLAALSTVNDKESGVMRMLVIAPLAHTWIVLAKALGATVAAVVQGLMLLVLLAVLGYLSIPESPLLLALGMVMTALTCASLGMLVASWSRTLENYATIMNVVIFPVFFLSGSLYPVQQLPDALRFVASINPYTHGVDVLKHAGMTGDAASFGPDFTLMTDFTVLLGFTLVALAIAAARFSRSEANEPLVHRLSRRRAG